MNAHGHSRATEKLNPARPAEAGRQPPAPPHPLPPARAALAPTGAAAEAAAAAAARTELPGLRYACGRRGGGRASANQGPRPAPRVLDFKPAPPALGRRGGEGVLCGCLRKCWAPR